MSVLSKKIVVSLFSLFAVILTVAFVFSGVGVENNALSLIIDKTFLEKNQIQMIGSPLRSWESADYQDGGLNSLTVVNYNKCIPVQQCTFEDCDVEGSREGKGHFCLPVSFSKIGDWAPDISIKVFGISLLENPAVYAAPVEHTQAAARLPDLNNNAYFMFSNSQNHYGFIWVVEVKGIDPNNPQRITSSMPANVVWWQKLNKCHSLAQCNDQYNPGNFNHPARISVVDSMAAIAFQNYSYTVQGKFSLAKVSNFFNNDKILIPKILETSTLPKYPRVRSADAVGFYDVSNPRRPKFIRKLIGDLPELWGGYPPGRDISEVAITKAGDYYHLNVGGTIYNYNGEGKDKTFAKNYRVTFPYSTKSIVPMFGDVSGNIFANIVYSNAAYPAGISLNSVPIFAETSEHIDYALTLQLIETQIAYNSGSKHRIDDSTNNTFFQNKNVFSTNIMAGEIDVDSENYEVRKDQVLADLFWKSEACKRAWGFQILKNGGYNVICHDMNPAGHGLHSKGRFLVRGVSPEHRLSIHLPETEFMRQIASVEDMDVAVERTGRF